jgi:CubicO group peptidase (beta-lactamase class C family)
VDSGREQGQLTRRQACGRLAAGFGAAARLDLEALAGPAETDMQDLLEPIREKHDLPALSGAVLKDGQRAAKGAVGVRKYGSDVRVTVGDQFHLGSCTKAMTATLIGMLVEQGELSWDTTLAASFPELASEMTPTFRGVTLDHLLAHRSGFSAKSWAQGKTFRDMHNLPGAPRAQRAAYVRMILREPAQSEPGAKFVYSNRNYAVAGAILERVTNTAWEAFITQRLFRPLGMRSAGFGAMGTPGRIDQPWQHTLSGTEHLPIGPGRYSDNPPVIAPAGTVRCAVEDWTRFLVLHLAGENGKDSLLRADTVRRLHTPQFGGEYAGGWILTERDWSGGRVLTHAGSNNQNFAVVWMAPLKHFVVVAVTNQGGKEAEKACDEVVATSIRRYLT